MTQILRDQTGKEAPCVSPLARAVIKRVCDRTGASAEQAKSIYRRTITRRDVERRRAGALLMAGY